VNTVAQLPDEVRSILALLRESIQAVLGDELVGLYLYGSLSSGDFDPASSDVDFVAAPQALLSDDACERLREMHAQIAASGLGLPFATHLEGSYIPRAAWRRYDPADARHPTIGVDWPFQIGFHDANWIIERAIVRERGVVLAGPPPATLLDPVTPEWLREATCQQMGGDWWRATIHDEVWLRLRPYAAFAVLTFCRALYTLEHGAYCSKPVAAAWVSERYPAWRPVITWALTRRGDHCAAHDDTTPGELADVLAFLRAALAVIQARCPQ
jgi:predicted nucleotidyltransferase